MWTYLNGKFVSEREAKISIFDRSYLYGEGVFETLRSYRGKPAFVEQHYQRLLKNAAQLNIAVPINFQTFHETLLELLGKNQLQDAVIRLTLSGIGDAFAQTRSLGTANLSIFVRSFERNEALYDTGVTLYASPTLVNDSTGVAGIKATSYLTKMIARQQAAEEKVYEVILRNHAGFWVEGSRTNLFIVKDEKIKTSATTEGLLPGVTRDVVLNLIQANDFVCEETKLNDQDLLTADEIFITGTTTEIMPVVRVTGALRWQCHAIGVVSQTLLQKYRELLTS